VARVASPTRHRGVSTRSAVDLSVHRLRRRERRSDAAPLSSLSTGPARSRPIQRRPRESPDRGRASTGARARGARRAGRRPAAARSRRWADVLSPAGPGPCPSGRRPSARTARSGAATTYALNHSPHSCPCRRVFPGVAASPVYKGMDREGGRPRHAVLQARPGSAPERRGTWCQPFVERTDGLAERKDLLASGLGPSPRRVTSPFSAERSGR